MYINTKHAYRSFKAIREASLLEIHPLSMFLYALIIGLQAIVCFK